MSEENKDKSADSPSSGCHENQGGLLDSFKQMPPRRKFLFGAAGALGGLASVVAGIPILGYVLGPAIIEDDKWVDAGKISDFPRGQTRIVDVKNPLRKKWGGASGKLAFYVRRATDGEFTCLSVSCTHLGCPVSWFEQSGLFLCPCHGGVYYANGDRASGPPPRGLYHYPHRIDKKNNKLMVRVGHMPTLHDVPSSKLKADLEKSA